MPPKASSDRLALWVGLAAAALIVAVVVTDVTVPRGNAGTGPVDVLLVLGTPAAANGTPTRAERWRVTEAVREFRAGRAPAILFAGGANANQFVEADAMAALANRMGVPQAALLRERDSLTTLENIANSQRILDAHHWTRVEVISSPEHLRRTSVMLANTHLSWRVHAAPTPERSRAKLLFAYVREAIGTAVLRWFGTGAEPALHRAAKVLRRFDPPIRPDS